MPSEHQNAAGNCPNNYTLRRTHRYWRLPCTAKRCRTDPPSSKPNLSTLASSQESKRPTQVSTELHLPQESTTPTLATELNPMANITTTAAAHNGSGVIQTACDPQQRYRTQPSVTRPQPPYLVCASPTSSLRSDITFDNAVDVDTNTPVTRPTDDMKKRTPTRRTSPPRTRSLAKTNSFPAQNPLSASSSSSSISRSSTSVAKSVAMAAPARALELVSNRSSTTGSSSTNATSTSTIPDTQNIGRVRQAANRIEEKILLNRQAQSSSSSLALIVRGKRSRSHKMDDVNQVFKYTRTQSHEGLPKRHMRFCITPTDGCDDSGAQDFSFRLPAGLDPSFPLGFVGQFHVPSQSGHTPAISPTAPNPLGHSSSARARSLSGDITSRINAPRLNKGEGTTAATMTSIAETLLRHIPTAHQTPPPPPSTTESLMSNPLTQSLRELPLATTSGSNTTHLSLPAINLPLLTENLRRSRNKNTRAQQPPTPHPKRVRLSLTYHLEHKDLNNQRAILEALDMEPVSPSYEQSSSSASTLSAAPRRSTRNRQPRSPPK